MNASYKYPIQLLREAESEMSKISHAKLFNGPKYRPILEKWAASVFGLGYEEWVGQCWIRMVERQDDSVDFLLKNDRLEFNFQLTERLNPERKRGLEYKKLEKDVILKRPYRPEAGSSLGPLWIKDAVKNKIERYSDKENLNLLVYVNFDAKSLARDQIIKQLQEFQGKFASIWLITNQKICSIFGNNFIGNVEGWGKISTIIPPQILSYPKN
jgi:hypothetical protein